MSAPPQPRPVGASLRTWALSGMIGAIVISMAISALSQPPRTPQLGPLADPSDAEQVGRGRQIYATLCAKCHGANLEGAPNWRVPLPDGSLPAPPHDATGSTWRYSDQELFAIVSGASTTRMSSMPAFGGMLREHEIWAVLAYIKSTWPQELRDRQGARQP
jgi:mono/diheme cytochrome c family protein